ncbi:MAG: O-antigen ligase family protein [Alphaproteobacteria bacterium]
MKSASAAGKDIAYVCTLASMAVGIAGFSGFYDNSGFTTFPPSLVLGLQVVVGSVGVISIYRRDRRQLLPAWPLAAFAAWAAMTAAWSDLSLLSLQRTALINIPALLLTILALADPSPRRSFAFFVQGLVALAGLSGIFIATVLVASEPGQGELRLVGTSADAFGMMVAGRKFPTWGIELDRYSGLFSNPNGLALLAAVALVALVGAGEAVIADRRIRTVAMVGLAVLLAVTLSRASIVFLLVGLVAVATLRAGWRRMAAIFGLAVLLLPALLMVLTVLGFLGDIHSLSAVATGDQGRTEAFDAGDRAAIWYSMLQVAGTVWPWGIGFGLTQELLFAPLGYVATGHSVALTLLVETGLPGLVLALAAWFAGALRYLHRIRPVDRVVITVLALLLALYAHQAFDASVFRYHWGHFILAYLIGATLNDRLAPAPRLE